MQEIRTGHGIQSVSSAPTAPYNVANLLCANFIDNDNARRGILDGLNEHFVLPAAVGHHHAPRTADARVRCRTVACRNAGHILIGRVGLQQEQLLSYPFMNLATGIETFAKLQTLNSLPFASSPTP